MFGANHVTFLGLSNGAIFFPFSAASVLVRFDVVNCSAHGALNPKVFANL
jgi:hypothetical protein